MSDFTFYRNYQLSYLEDRALVRGLYNFWTRVWVALGVLLLLLLPQVLPQYWLYTMNLAVIAVVGAVGLNLLTGTTGQISLAHASVLAIRRLCNGLARQERMCHVILVIPASGAVARIGRAA
jgi:branched-chain amino acid transport system permease protein